MAKKKQGKKHKFKYAAPIIPGQVEAVGGLTSSVSSSKLAVAGGGRINGANITPGRDFSYVAVDLRKIGILAISLIALELIIWFLFTHTGIGPSVYQMVQV